MTGTIRNKHQIIIDTEPSFSGTNEVRFKLTVDGQDRVVVDNRATPRTTVVGEVYVTGILNMGSQRIEALADPNSNDDALNLGYADGRYVNASGDTMSGILNMGSNRIEGLANPNTNDDAINLGYLNGRLTAMQADIDAAQADADAAQANADAAQSSANTASSSQGNYVLKAGDTMTGNLVMSGASIVSGSDNTGSIGTGPRSFLESHILNMFAGNLRVGTIANNTGDNITLTATSGQVGLISGDWTVTNALKVTGNVIPTYMYGGSLGYPGNVWEGSHIRVMNADSLNVGYVRPNPGNPLHLIGDTTDGGQIFGQWKLMEGATITAGGADLGERYAADDAYEPGTVVVFGGDAEITASTFAKDNRVAGIITADPALRLNGEAGSDRTHPYVALKGRVPCRMVGPVSKGDLLTTSDLPGTAQQATDYRTGTILGKALGELGNGEVGIIEVFVALM